MILFFNKVDLFRSKIQKVNLNCAFPDYDQGLDSEKALEYIKNQYLAKSSTLSKQKISFKYTWREQETYLCAFH